MSKLLVVFSIGAALIAGATSQIRAQGGACDRACLEGFVDRYLDATIAHDPKLLPLSRNVKFSENGVQLDIGDAHWKTMTAKGPYRIFVTDVEAGQVAFIGTIKEEGMTNL